MQLVCFNPSILTVKSSIVSQIVSSQTQTTLEIFANPVRHTITYTMSTFTSCCYHSDHVRSLGKRKHNKL